jgi:cytidylate kinase
MSSSGNYIIAIDGPTASGKGTVAKLIAKRFGIVTLCTGAIYRAITIYFLDNEIKHGDLDKITDHIGKIKIDIRCERGATHTFINDRDVTPRLHEIKTSVNVAGFSKQPIVRARVKEIQKQFASSESLVCEGRDIGSVVFPEAKYKFYLTASLKTRASRRHKQEIAGGEDISYESVRNGINQRDIADKTREVSPLVRAKGAKVINSSNLSAEQTADKIIRIINKQMYRENKNFVTPKDFQPLFFGRTFRYLLKIFVFPVFRVLYPYVVLNKKELKKFRGQAVICAFNHRSNLDGFFALCIHLRRKVYFISKEVLFTPGTFSNFLLRSVNAFPTRNGNEMAIIRHSLNILKSGHALCIYPEGRRNFNPEDALAIRSGTALISIKSGIPIVPIMSNRKPRLFRLTKFKVGRTIYPQDYADKDAYANALLNTMKTMLDGFEIDERKDWDKVPVANARAICFVGDKIVLIKRVKEGREYYVFPGGHVDKGENSRYTATRELKEETNIVTDSTQNRLIYKRMQNGEMHAVYHCRYKSGEVAKTDAEEYVSSPSAMGHDGKERGTYEPVLLDISKMAETTIYPANVKFQIIKDLKKYGRNLTRSTIFLK